jgi:hypothetical protein
VQTLSFPAKVDRLRRPSQDLVHLVLRSQGQKQHFLFVLEAPFAGAFECDQSPLAGVPPHPSQAMLRKGIRGPIVGLRTAPGLWELYDDDGRVLCISWRRKSRGVWWADQGRLGGDLERHIPPCEPIEITAFDELRAAAELEAWRIKERARIKRNIAKLESQALVDDTDTLRGLAERANALRGQVERRGQQWAIPKYDGSPPEWIEEASSQNVSGLVEKLFHRAKRAERRVIATAERIAAWHHELRDLEQGSPKAKQRPRTPPPPTPLKGIRSFALRDGHELLVGRSAQGNQQLTFKMARGRDLWFHLRDGPGSHVILRLAKNEEPGASLLLVAAAMALHYSSLRGERADIRFAYRRDLEAVSGQPGKALVRREQVLLVDPLSAVLRSALEQMGLELNSNR